MNVAVWLLVITGSLGLLFGGGALTYRVVKSQYPLEPFTWNADASGVEGPVLLATHRTDFKTQVLADLGRRLEASGVRVDVVDASTVTPQTVSGYPKVVVFSAVQSGRLLPEVRRLVETLPGDYPVELFLTADSGHWSDHEVALDAVTAASGPSGRQVLTDGLEQALLGPRR